MSVDLIFYAVFTAAKIGKTGLTVTVDVDAVVRSSGSRNALVTAFSATEGRNGFYFYRLTGADLLANDYVVTFKTADATVDMQHIHALWSSFSIGYDAQLVNLDATISSRLAGASYTTPPTAGAIADQVWDEAISGHLTPGSTGESLDAAGDVTDPLLNAVPGSYASGTAGAALGKIGSGQIETVSPVASGGDVTVHQGDDYKAEDGRALSWTDSDGLWPDLTGATIVLRVEDLAEYSAVAVNPGGAQQGVQVELTANDTGDLPVGMFGFQVIVTQSDADVATLIEGDWVVKKKFAAAGA